MRCTHRLFICHPNSLLFSSFLRLSLTRNPLFLCSCQLIRALCRIVFWCMVSAIGRQYFKLCSVIYAKMCISHSTASLPIHARQQRPLVVVNIIIVAIVYNAYTHSFSSSSLSFFFIALCFIDFFSLAFFFHSRNFLQKRSFCLVKV
jgi:hypothetical protein